MSVTMKNIFGILSKQSILKLPTDYLRLYFLIFKEAQLITSLSPVFLNLSIGKSILFHCPIRVYVWYNEKYFWHTLKTVNS